MTASRTKEPAFPVVGDTGRADIGVQRFGQRVVAGHRMVLAAFLMQPNRPAGAAWPQILDLHLQRGIDAREAVGQCRNQRPVAQIAHARSRDRIEQLTPGRGFEHRGLTELDDMLRPTHHGSRVVRHDLTGDQPIEHHADRGELLLDRRRLETCCCSCSI